MNKGAQPEGGGAWPVFSVTLDLRAAPPKSPQAHTPPLPLLIGCLVRDANLDQEVHSS